MNFIDYAHRKIPDYYDTMYLDGFEPWEIQVAIRKKHRLLAEEQRKKREELENQFNYINITSEIKIK